MNSTNGQMHGKCVSIQRKWPNMKVMNGENAVDCFQVEAYLIIIDIAGNTFHQDMRSIAYQPNGRRQY